MCKFKVSFCRNGENYNFADEIEDIRQPPPKWQELVEDRLPSGKETEKKNIFGRRSSSSAWATDGIKQLNRFFFL